MSLPSNLIELTGGRHPLSIEYVWLNQQLRQAPLMIFLHEGLGSVSMWREFPAMLCEALTCRGLVYSRPGYGRSSQRAPNEHWATDFLHRQAFEVLPHLLTTLAVDVASEPIWLFGHSDGASIALLYAARYSKCLKGVIALAPHVMVEDIAVARIQKIRQTYLFAELRDKLARHHANPDSAFWGWNDIWLDSAFRAWDITTEITEIACPLLAVQGRDDEYGTVAQLTRIHSVVKHCEWVELPDCGHSPHRDQKDALVRLVSDFYARH